MRCAQATGLARAAHAMCMRPSWSASAARQNRIQMAMRSMGLHSDSSKIAVKFARVTGRALPVELMYTGVVLHASAVLPENRHQLCRWLLQALDSVASWRALQAVGQQATCST